MVNYQYYVVAIKANGEKAIVACNSSIKASLQVQSLQNDCFNMASRVLEFTTTSMGEIFDLMVKASQAWNVDTRMYEVELVNGQPVSVECVDNYKAQF